MEKLFLVFATLLLAAKSPAQTNEPVKLALIAETGEASAALDILTAQLTSNQKVHLLERDEIDKVYREQGMSAANRDDLKLGQILGADGLLVLNIVRTSQTTNLTARLIAVKPGVVLTDGGFSWPLKDPTTWAQSVAVYLDSFLPKLMLTLKDAIPISVVNLRSANQSKEANETEAGLKLLTIQRLSQERQFLVLERQKMQMLTEEKELKSDESAFWDGSYLLDGVVDQNGYSKDTITINARLTPPKGGVPLQFEVSGSRTNLAEVINQLALKVNEALKVSSTVKEWNPADEAQQYFEEAQWALKWGVYSEAQAAADSAWALGKHDVNCAAVRVKAYVLQVTANVVEYEISEDSVDCIGGYNSNDQPRGPPVSKSVVQAQIKQIVDEHPYGVRNKITYMDSKNSWGIDYVTAEKPPDPNSIGCALHALELYYEFSQNSSEGDLIKVASEISGWKNSDWYNLGIEDLVAASQVLQNFNFLPDAQKPVDRLTELRTLTRSVADWISQSPSVHDSYFVGDRLATHDELANTMGKNPNIFRCEVNWGCLWQEKPEDEIALYRELMNSPVFSYIHEDFWVRELQMPRLVTWNENDQHRVPMVWNDFIQELIASTNVLLKLEAKAIEFADADTELKMAATFTNLFNGFLENSDALVADNVEVLYLDWGTGNLVSAKISNGITTDTKDSLRQLFYSEYFPKLEAMDQEYWSKTVPGAQSMSGFEKQKEYLKANKPFDFMEFADLFGSPDYSKAEAVQIQPLIAAYKSNLVAQIKSISDMQQKATLIGAVAQVGFLENNVNRILNSQPQLQPKIQVSKPIVAKTVAVEPTVTNESEIVTNIITVGNFFAIPLDSLYHMNDGEQLTRSSATITAHHWFEGKLLLDFQYSVEIELRDEKGTLMDDRTVAGDAIAIFDPITERWKIINCPEDENETAHIISQNNFYHRSALLNGELLNCDEKQIRKYDFQNQQWHILSISDGNNYELFAIDGHLYAANENKIFEIIDGGNATRLFASTRRSPPATTLDKLDNLGTPVLFAGTNHLLQAYVNNAFYLWQQNEWHKEADFLSNVRAEVFDDGVLFRGESQSKSDMPDKYGRETSDFAVSLFRFETQVTSPELCLWQKFHDLNDGHTGLTIADAVHSPRPLWEMPSGWYFTELAAALDQSHLYLLADHFDSHGKSLGEPFNAELLCFSSGLSLPQVLFLKFDSPVGCAPLTKIDPNSPDTWPKIPPAWILPTTNFLFFGLDKPAPPFLNQSIGYGCNPGIWLVPFSKVESVIAVQKRIQIAEQQQLAATAEQSQKKLASAEEQARKNLIAKYDRNHNGVIDPEEKEEALDDTNFIESELDIIDTNHNGWLDAEELVYFDANKNKILDPKEQEGIDIAQHLLAERLLKKFDADGDGRLNPGEFNKLLHSVFAVKIPASPGIGFSPRFLEPADDNNDGYVDLAELENYLKNQTRRSLRSQGASAAALISQNGVVFNEMPGPQQLFKATVEFYWRQHP